MNFLMVLLAWLHLGISSSMARKFSNRNSQPQDQDQRSQQMEQQSNEDNINHIKIPILDIRDVNQGDYPKVYEEINDDPPPQDPEEFEAASEEYDPPEYTPPKSGEIFDEDTYHQIVKSVKIPDIKFAGDEKDSDAPLDPDLLPKKEDAPEIPPELVNIKIPTSIPRPIIQRTKKTKRKKKKKSQSEAYKKPKIVQEVVTVEPSRSPDQQKEYTQVIDNSNPKEEVIIIKPARKKKKKKKTNSVYLTDDFDEDTFFVQPKPSRAPQFFIHAKPPTAAIKIKQKPKNVNVIIQNKKKRPLLITHQNGDVIYWYPSQQVTAPKKSNKYLCRRTRFGNQCMNIAKHPMKTLGSRHQFSSHKFPATVKPTPNFLNINDDDGYMYKVVRNQPYQTKKKVPAGVLKFGQSLFFNDHEENGSFFKEIDAQGHEGVDEPEAENHEDERITDEEVEADKAAPGDDEEGEGEEGEDETPNVYDEQEANEYSS